jgi:hypothetical protein
MLLGLADTGVLSRWFVPPPFFLLDEGTVVSPCLRDRARMYTESPDRGGC